MSKIKKSGLDQYGAEPFELQQFGTVGIEDEMSCHFDVLHHQHLSKWCHLVLFELHGTAVI